MNFVLRLIPSLLFISLLASSGALPPVDVFGIVTQARNASLSYGTVSAGASVYDGDTLATEVDGTLTLRAASSMIHLGRQSRVSLRSASAADQCGIVIPGGADRGHRRSPWRSRRQTAPGQPATGAGSFPLPGRRVC